MGLPWEAPCWKAAGKNYNSIIILSVLEEESYSENVVVVKDHAQTHTHTKDCLFKKKTWIVDQPSEAS